MAGHFSENYRKLAGSVASQAREFYRRSRESLPARDRRSMVAAELMGAVYWRLLLKLEKRQFNVFGPEPVRLSKPCKLLLVMRSWLKYALGQTSPGYG
jgi:phytoene/squalene synthetase